MKLIGASVSLSWLSLKCVSWPSVDARGGQMQMRQVAKCDASLHLSLDTALTCADAAL